MISVGIDVSKGKSMVCILKPNEDYVCKPFELLHCKEDLELLDELLKKLDGEVKVVMEATGIYNLPILTFLVEKGYFVSVINPCVMKKYARNINFRNVKTDKRDSVTIAN
jgi:transposase